MVNVNEYLYYLVLSSYLNFKTTEILLNDNYKLTIKAEENVEWVGKQYNTKLISEISFNVKINNLEEENNIAYVVMSKRSLNSLLELSKESKTNFILRRKFNILDGYYRIKTKGKIKSRKIKKVILEEILNHVHELEEIKDKKLQKKKK